jgi:hypothetical protein
MLDPAGISTNNVWVIPTSYLQRKDEKVWGDEAFLTKIRREWDLVKLHLAMLKEISEIEEQIEVVERRNQELREEEQMLLERNSQDLIDYAVAETARLQRIIDQLDRMDANAENDRDVGN